MQYFQNFKFKIFNNIAEIEDIKANPSRYFFKISPWHIEKVLNAVEVSQANIIYSQWLGYLKEEFSDQKSVELFKSLQEKHNWVYAHTSGHADLEALQMFASSINPKKLIPIHTEHKEEFQNYFENVAVLADNEVYDTDSNLLTDYQVDQLNKIFEDDL